MGLAAFNQPTTKATLLIIVQHVDVAQITKSGIVCDQTGEADLSCSIQKRKTKAVLDGYPDRFSINAGRPGRLREVIVYGFQLEKAGSVVTVNWSLVKLRC